MQSERPNPFFAANSPHLPSSPLVRVMRLWLPLALCLIGVVLLFADQFNGFGVDAFAAFGGAGSSIWLINFLWRLGISGDDERELEARDRAYLAEHGHWPDEPAPAPRSDPAPAPRSDPAPGPDQPSTRAS